MVAKEEPVPEHAYDWHYLIRTKAGSKKEIEENTGGMVTAVSAFAEKMGKNRVWLGTLAHHTFISPYSAAYEQIDLTGADSSGKSAVIEALIDSEAIENSYHRPWPLEKVDKPPVHEISYRISFTAKPDEEPRLFNELKKQLKGVGVIERTADPELFPNEEEMETALKHLRKADKEKYEKTLEKLHENGLGKALEDLNPEEQAKTLEGLLKAKKVVLQDGNKKLSIEVAEDRDEDIDAIMELEKKHFGEKDRASREQTRERLRLLPEGMRIIAWLHENGEKRAVGHTLLIPTTQTEKVRRKIGETPAADLLGKKGIFDPHGQDVYWDAITGETEGVGKIRVGKALRLAAMYNLVRRGIMPRRVFLHAVGEKGKNTAARMGLGLEDEKEMAAYIHSPVICAMHGNKSLSDIGAFPQEVVPLGPNIIGEKSVFETMREKELEYQNGLGHKNLSEYQLATRTAEHLLRVYEPATIVEKMVYALRHNTHFHWDEHPTVKGFIQGLEHTRISDETKAELILRWTYSLIAKRDKNFKKVLAEAGVDPEDHGEFLRRLSRVMGNQARLLHGGKAAEEIKRRFLTQ